MHDSVHRQRLARSPRARLLLAAALVSGILVAGCGGSSNSPPVASVSSTTTPTSGAAGSSAATTTGGSAASSGSPASGDLQSQELAFARCMRANGVPNFPDPNPGGGFDVLRRPGGSGIDPLSPVYKAANAKCQTLLPNGGAGPAYSAPAGVQLLNIAKCMREHGISEFPDPEKAPTSSLPPPKPGYSRITDYQGWLLEFPVTVNPQSPAYTRAAAACDAQFLNRPQ